MVNSTRTRCSQCGLPMNPQAQFCEHCGCAVARGAIKPSAEELWDDETENPTVNEMKLPRTRPVAAPPVYKFQPEHLITIGVAGAAVSGVIALLLAAQKQTLHLGFILGKIV